MEHRIIKTDLDHLFLDHQNPRLWFQEFDPTSQISIGRTLGLHSNLDRLIDHMTHNAYIPEPLLTLQTQDGFTVVDGNRRLLAAKVLTDPEFQGDREITRNKTHPEISPQAAKDIRETAIAVFHSWDEIHPLRVKRQSANPNALWNNHTCSHDFRRLLLMDVSPNQIADMYWWRKDSVLQRVNALNFYEQVSDQTKRKTSTNYAFRRIAAALQQPNIRKVLTLREPQSYAPKEQPLDHRNMETARRLLDHLTGNTEEHTQPRITDENEIGLLDRVYGSSKGLQRMESWPRESAKDVCNWLDGRYDQTRAQDEVGWLHAAALSALKEIKDAQPDLVPHPGTVHVAHAAHTRYNDASAQYTVTLESAHPDEHQTAAALLQKTLAKDGFRCNVEFRPNS